jgi:pimeloyl-ACP methyl ester carboxylesterase
MDDDLEALSREGLIHEIKRLRAGIRAHRDSSGHDLCWHHPQLLGLLATAIAIVSIAFASPGSAQSVDPAVAQLGDGFASDAIEVDGVTLHYVRGGTGPPVVLLHGFPQNWYAFHRIMPRLARTFTVIAVDMRGIGRSSIITDGYDASTIANDIQQLAKRLKLDPIYLVGHDNGGMVAYAFARIHPREARGVMVLDVPLPGIEPWDKVKADPALWHFGFHQTPDLPERLIAGREFLYFRSFFDRLALNRAAIPDSDVQQYVTAYSGADRLRAGLAFYRRAYPSSEAANEAARSPLDVPIVLAGGDHSVGGLNPTIADALRARGCANVTVETIGDSGHWVVDEQPDAVARLIERHAASDQMSP